MTEAQGIVLQVEDERIRQRAAQHHLPVRVQAGYDLPWERTLFLDPAIGRVPWEQIPRGFDFLARWEAAAPVWSYETLASDAAAGAERERTAALIGDLRVPLYETGLLFVRRCERGQALLDAWRVEGSGDARLAFLRALYEVKPLFCALPRSWLQKAAAATVSVASQRMARVERTKRARREENGLIRVEICPGRYVRCKPEEADRLVARFRESMLRREKRRNRGGNSGKK